MDKLKRLLASLGDLSLLEASIDELEELCDEIFYLPEIFIEAILEIVSYC